ncbi:MAG: hypothetical protein CO189_02675 [candidate division Zixibacteria bacterium CG_4_9_14_3_um_filter_46_8]|nr:MAG: hypothetical protein CO189_02675 [candidate division Zixibacteria bacterium CG_4_9_14_3_um_filter_46_8]
MESIIIDNNTLIQTYIQKLRRSKQMNLKLKIILAGILMLTAACCFALAKPSMADELIPSNEPISKPLDAQGTGLFYDSGSSGYLPQYNQAGTMFAVRFTPAEDCSLKFVQIYSTLGTGDVLMHVWDDDSGNPGTDVVTPFTVTLTGDNTPQVITISPIIDLGGGDFHVGFELINAAPPYAVTDSDGNTEQRSKAKTPSGSWTVLDNDLVIRCYVEYYVPTNDELLFYDGAPSYILPSYNQSGSQFSVRFTNTRYPDEACSLLAVQIVTSSGPGNALVHVWKDDGGAPGVDLMTPLAVVLAGDASYQDIALTAPVEITDQDFHVGWELAQVAPPYATTDGDGNTQNRSRAKMPSGAWTTTDNDLNIRASVRYYVEPAPEPEVIAYDDAPAYGVSSPHDSGSMFAVRFTPEQSHFPDTCVFLYYVEIVTTSGAGSGQVHVWRDNPSSPGNPGADVIDPIPTTFSGNNTYQRIDIEPPVALEAYDFHAGWELLEASPPLATRDAEGNTDNRSKAKTPSGSWTNTDSDMNIRAHVIYYNCQTSVDEGNEVEIPTGFGLAQNYPNPFNATTNIIFGIEKASDVDVSVYNLAGQLVETVFSDNLNPGVYTVIWNASKYSSGIYFYKLTAGEQTTTKRMALLK